MQPLITVDKLQVFLGGRKVITDACIEIGHGEFIGLLGPNGAGKTTFMRSILGLVPVKSGAITVDASIGYVPQRHDVAWEFPWSVRKTVLSGRTGIIGWFRRPRRRCRAAVDESGGSRRPAHRGAFGWAASACVVGTCFGYPAGGVVFG